MKVERGLLLDRKAKGKPRGCATEHKNLHLLYCTVWDTWDLFGKTSDSHRLYGAVLCCTVLDSMGTR